MTTQKYNKSEIMKEAIGFIRNASVTDVRLEIV